MTRCLLWGTGKTFNDNIALIKYYEDKGQYTIEGITSDDAIYGDIYGYKFFRKNELKKECFDIVVVLAKEDKYIDISKEIKRKGFNDNVIIPYYVMGMVGFNVDTYIRIKSNTPSIFASNCWGGVIYNRLGLQFKSPLINMYERHNDFLKMLKNPKDYMSKQLDFIEMGYENRLQKKYPIARCGDIILHFNHYNSFEQAKDCWEKRKRRINWDNLLIMMFEENEELAYEFAEMPYEKKICFVPFPTNHHSLCYVDFYDKGGLVGFPFWQVVMDMAWGRYSYINFFDLLDKGTINKIVN